MGVIAEHLDELRRRNLAPSTISQRGYVLGRLCRFAGHPILELGYRDLVEFTGRPGLGAEGRAVEVSHVRQFYAWAVDIGRLEVDPAARLRRPKVHQRLPRPVSEEDLALAVSLAPLRVRPWILLAACAGLRCKEIAQLRADDIWWHGAQPLILVRNGKGGSDEAVPMARYLSTELRACSLPSRGYLFPRLDGRPGHLPAHRVSQLGNAFLRSIGLDVTMHQFRHRFGTEALKAAGGNMRVAQELLRHRSIRSTQIYTFVDPREKAHAVERMPRIEGTIPIRWVDLEREVAG